MPPEARKKSAFNCLEIAMLGQFLLLANFCGDDDQPCLIFYRVTDFYHPSDIIRMLFVGAQSFRALPKFGYQMRELDLCGLCCFRDINFFRPGYWFRIGGRHRFSFARSIADYLSDSLFSVIDFTWTRYFAFLSAKHRVLPLYAGGDLAQGITVGDGAGYVLR